MAKNDDFNLEKELAQSKRNINLNEIFEPNKYLITRKWDYINDDKIMYLENKVEEIYRQLKKDNINNLMRQINSISLDNYYEDYKITENKYKISCLSSLNFLVEATYYFRNDNFDIKQYDINELKPYIEKFRNVSGDGDCFYRGLIFSLLENIILTNNIMQMKELLILYYEKINIKNKLIKEKEYLERIKKLNISIVSEILYIIIFHMENDISKAYKILLKVFLFCKDFDSSIIFFTRYLIYEYISANEDKIYSKEYQLELGCLLPEDFVEDKGNKNEYFFENFYSLHLMKPKTFAEKIILYVAPFVFNIKLNILIYDYGMNGAQSAVMEKKFFDENINSSQIEINLLFRKSHYDIYYKKQFYQEHQKNLNILINKKEDSIPKHNKNNSKSYNFEYQFQNRDNKEEKNHTVVKNNLREKNDIKEKINVQKKNNIDKIDENQNININKPINKSENLYHQNNMNNMPTCLECHQFYSNMENAFGLCDQCLSNNFKTLLLTAFFEFLQNKNNIFNSRKKFKELLLQKKCNISIQENISILEAINNSKFKFNDLFISVRKQLCLYCGQPQDEYQYFIELPCNCRICTKKCFIEYVSYISKFIKLNEDKNSFHFKYVHFLSCFCGFIYNTQHILKLITELMQKGMKEQIIIYQDYINNIWNWKCFLCTNDFKINENFFKLKFKCKNIDKKLLNPKTEFKHLLCEVCFYKYNLNKQKIIACNICELEHEVEDIKKVNEKNEEENCIIF